MCRYVAVALLLVNYIAGAPPPLRLTIDCSDERVNGIRFYNKLPEPITELSDGKFKTLIKRGHIKKAYYKIKDYVEDKVPYGSAFRYTDRSVSDYNRNSRLHVDSFCSLIHNAFPKAVQDGKFILIEPDDQTGYSDTQVPISIAPPTGFIPGLRIPKLKIPKLRIPSLNVPILKEHSGPFTPPRIGSPMTSTAVMRIGDESSAERMEKFKKGVQKMLHVVKVLGQIDQYLSERTRIIVDKLTKTFAE